ncbi:hypothetical protein F503_01891 [Ophiostoma piceae UAMH 11346]|uniref:Penicillin-binding protein n=1 Tax=Ophiostoma piceae (strain UAMH 11346) TaxID=1262450 RepID=S3CBK2_OPHP1|nr:hypothetical protein F503_01891 [Ophiostoma piceae UAMH 11346]
MTILFSPSGDMSESLSSASAIRDRLSKVTTRIDELKNIAGAAGVSVGVISYGHTVLDYHTGYADIDRGIVADSNTRYTIGSLTKAFVAATLAEFIDDKKTLSSWDDSVVDVVNELALAVPDNHISLIDMLAHRTGLSRIDPLWLGAEGQTLVDKEDTIKLCNHLRPICPVRSKWLYNNWMYGLAGELIERLDPDHRPWGEVVAERVLKPLGLNHTTVCATDLQGVSQAQPYVIRADKTPLLVKHMPPLQDGVLAAAGGIRSTTADLLQWGRFLMSQINEAASKSSGAEPTINMMFTSHSFISSSSTGCELYGLGWAKVTTPAQFGKIGFNPAFVKAMPEIGTTTGRNQHVFYHNGAITGYNNCIMLLPQTQTAIVVLTNSMAQGDIADWIAQAVLQAVLGEEDLVDLVSYAEESALVWRSQYQTIKDALEADRKPDTETPPSAALVGKYWHTTHALFLDVFEDEGELRFSFGGKPDQVHTLTHYANDTFCFLPASDNERIRRGLFHYATPAWLLEFKKDSTGRYTEVLWNIESDAPGPESFVRET